MLNNSREPELDQIAAMAAAACEMPIALVALVGEDRQWYKGRVGMEASQTPLEGTFCKYALDQHEALVIPDATKDPRFAKSPFVTGEPGIRFYAGIPLITSEDVSVGTLCVIDRKLRTLSTAQEWVLRSLAEQVMQNFESRLLTRKIAFNDQGYLPVGIHDMTLGELRSLVTTGFHRRCLWPRLVSFLSWPILNRQFSHAYIGGGFVSTDPNPQDIDVILQPRESFGPGAFAALSPFFLVRLERILAMYSVHLHFWVHNAPGSMSDYRTFFQYVRPTRKQPVPDGATRGIVRIDLENPAIIAQFQDALDRP